MRSSENRRLLVIVYYKVGLGFDGMAVLLQSRRGTAGQASSRTRALAAVSIVDSGGRLGKGDQLLTAALHFAEDVGSCGAAVFGLLFLARR